MKSSAILVGVAAAFTAAQQGFPDGFPQCGVTCVQNMLSQASELGCADMTAACLCTKQNFIYGVRDCATESCPDQSAAQQVIQYGSQYCAGAGVDISGAPTATGATPSATTTVVATASPTNTADGSASSSGSSADSSAGSSTGTGTGGATASGSDGSGPVAIATTTIQSTITNSDGSVITSDVGTSTVFSSGSALSTGSAASGSESVTGSLTTGVTESSFTSDGSTLVTSVTTTGTADANETSEGSNDSATETPSSTSNPAAQRTAAPVGLIAAAGLAALML